MKYDEYGQAVIDSKMLVEWLYTKPELALNNLVVQDPDQYNSSIEQLHLDWPKLTRYQRPDITVEEFDRANQQQWFMPEKYSNMDIAAWLVEQCQTEKELERVGKELLLFQERNLFPLLSYLKYLVDTMREHGIIWGVGRGSSVASYVLYLIGIHKINSLEFDLDITEFLKEQHEKNI